MAQGDLFRQFVETTKQYTSVLDRAQQANVINEQKRLEILGDVYTRELNISEVRSNMRKSDVKSLNVLKRLSSIGKKISSQTKENFDLKKKIEKNERFLLNLEQEITKARKNGNIELEKALTKQKEKLKFDQSMNKVTLQQMRRTIPVLGRMGSYGAAVSDSMVMIGDIFGSIIPIVGGILGGLIKVGMTLVKLILNPLKKAFSIFLEMQSTVGNLAADIGLTAVESRNLLNNFASLTLSAMKFGGSMKDVATVIQQFSEVTGKNRFFNEREIEQLVELGLGTGLGVQGASELAASFDNIGVSLEKTINLTEKARNLSAKMNVNTTKVLKTYQGLVQSLTGIGFGKGLDNLTKLSAKATAIRFDIVASTKAFADAFFEPEKAVEAAARMQVLGGKFASSFGDPMQLAFESMSDPTALAEKFADMVSSIVKKDSKGNYFIPPAERKSLKLAAEALGQSYEDAVGTAIEQGKIADKMVALSQSGFSMTNFSEEERLGLTSLMQLNEKGKFEIKMSDGTMRLVENLTSESQLKQILKSREANEKAAIQRLNMMQRFENVINRFMVGFSKVFDQLFGGTNFESFLQMVENAGERISNFIVKDLLGEGGLANGFDTLIGKAKNIFLQVEKIFNDKGSFMSKVGETLKLLFKDVAVPIISEVIKFIVPFLKAGIAELLHIIGGALPNILGGSSIQKYAEKLRGESASSDKSGLLSGMYESTNATTLPPGDKSANQGMSAIAKMKGAAMGTNVAMHYGRKGIGKGLTKVGSGMIYYQSITSGTYFTTATTYTNTLYPSFVPTNGFMITYDGVNMLYSRTLTVQTVWIKKRPLV
jgi:hypothetical protein